MVRGIYRNDFGGDLVNHHNFGQREFGGNRAKTGDRQQGCEGDGFAQCVAFHRQNIPCDRWQQTALKPGSTPCVRVSIDAVQRVVAPQR
ncbi:hypothetical protein D9M72_606810 [compost metagenome]